MPSTFVNRLLFAALAFACALVAAPGAMAQSSSMSGGGAAFQPPPPPPAKAKLVNGRLLAPASAPTRVKRVIAAANQIVEKPYVYGGGHRPYRAASSTAATTARAPCRTRSTAAASSARRSRAAR